jgi:2,5-diketo-D-gluconate reductase A
MTGFGSLTLPSGAQIPLLGFGTWPMRDHVAEDAVRCALEAGYRHLDTATMYANEAEVGRALRASGIARNEVFVTTKLPGGQDDRARATLEASLQALGVEQLDLWLIHWPTRDIVATWHDFVRAKEEGLVHDIGVSNFSVAELEAITSATGVPPAVNQIEWGPQLHRADLYADHQRRGVILEGYSPLKATNLRDPVLVAIAESHGVSSAQVVLRWHLQHQIVVIPKSAHPQRIAANADLGGFKLSEPEMRRIDALGG